MATLKKVLQHRLDRCNLRISTLELAHKGKESNYTYHGGYNLGYEKGMARVLEELLDSDILQ